MKLQSSIIDLIMDIVSPEHCEITGNRIEFDSTEINFLSQAGLDRLPLAENSAVVTNQLLSSFESQNLYINRACSLISLHTDFNYMRLIHLFKYSGFSETAYQLGKLLARKLKDEIPLDFYYIIPVPIHSARFRERGYNQSLYIAKGLTEVLNKTILDSVIIRKKNTVTQTQLDKNMRLQNVEDIFAVRSGYFSSLHNKNKHSNISKTHNFNGSNILLVDDVLTTGATLNSLAKCCNKLNAGRIYVATIATVRD
jgi:ComF family protein